MAQVLLDAPRSDPGALSPPPGSPGGRPGAASPPGFVKDDLRASIVVFLVALPLCLGIALASGAPLMSGVLAGIIGGLVIAPLSPSALLVSGPAAGLTTIVVTALATLGSFEAFLLAVFLAGLMQLGLGAVGAGIISYYFPSSVIKGMLAAIGLILILKQIPHALGYDADTFGDEAFLQATGENTFTAIARAFAQIQPGALIIATLGLAILALFTRPAFKKLGWLPGPLAVVVMGVVLNTIFIATAPELAIGATHLVQLPVPDSAVGLLAELAFPAWSMIGSVDVWRVAVTLAIVASLETLLSVEATDKLDPYKRQTPTSRELLAQGAGNTVAGLIGALPLTGVIVRSSANVDAGGKTKRSAILHGLWLLLAVVALPRILNLIPLSALSAVLLYTGFKLAHPSLFRAAWKVGRHHFIPFTVTIVAILFTDLLVGIAVGLTVGVFYILRDHAQGTMLMRVSAPGAVLTRYTLPSQATFLGKANVATTLAQIAPGSRVEIDARKTSSIDYDVVELLLDFRQTAKLKNIDYRLVGVPDVPITPSHD